MRLPDESIDELVESYFETGVHLEEYARRRDIDTETVDRMRAAIKRLGPRRWDV